jgi:hypothetical protein
MLTDLREGAMLRYFRSMDVCPVYKLDPHFTGLRYLLVTSKLAIASRFYSTLIAPFTGLLYW